MTGRPHGSDGEPAGPRRRAVLLSGLAGAGAGVITGAGAAVAREQPPAPPPDPRLTAAHAVARDFRGATQAGIVEPPPSHAAFVAFDLPAGADRDLVRRLLTVWTDDIERLTSGRGTLTDLEPELAAVPASLTVTVGVGPRTVEAAGAERPAWLAPLPAFPEIDRLQDAWSGGDVLLQVCADSPTTVAHAQRRLTTSAGDLATVRWVQRGFREPYRGPGYRCATSSARSTARSSRTSRASTPTCSGWARTARPGCGAAPRSWCGGSGCSWTPGTAPTGSPARTRSAGGSTPGRR